MYCSEGVVSACIDALLDSPSVPGVWRTAGGENAYDNSFASGGVWCDISGVPIGTTSGDCFSENTGGGACGDEGCLPGLLLGLVGGDKALLSSTGSITVRGSSFECGGLSVWKKESKHPITPASSTHSGVPFTKDKILIK